MSVTSKDDQRRERLREFHAQIDQSNAAVSALALIVQGREARTTSGAAPLEMAFAETTADGPALPAGLWVALRRGDVEMAVELLARASNTYFVVGEREEMGSGYKLETVEEKRPVPDLDLLQAQLASLLGIPRDVVAVLADWGPDDPRTRAEIDALLDSRFGAADGAKMIGPIGPIGPIDSAKPSRPAEAIAAAGSTELSMSVDELADVLQLSAAQAKVLATLARRTELTITPSVV